MLLALLMISVGQILFDQLNSFSVQYKMLIDSQLGISKGGREILCKLV